jgi:hypothetical protein
MNHPAAEEHVLAILSFKDNLYYINKVLVSVFHHSHT